MSLYDFIENEPDNSTPTPDNKTHFQLVSAGKVEKLSFLKPCSLCNGRNFISKQKGGFFCIKCQPNEKGIRVFAAGNRKNTKNESDTHLNQARKNEARPQRKGTAEKRHHFQTSFPWIMEHLAELQKAGWTRPALFRRGKHRFPIGEWGVAWYPIWTESNLKINICKRSSAIRFSFVGTDGRAISQAAYPPQGKR